MEGLKREINESCKRCAFAAAGEAFSLTPCWRRVSRERRAQRDRSGSRLRDSQWVLRQNYSLTAQFVVLAAVLKFCLDSVAHEDLLFSGSTVT
jgi:hypothetical protein